MIAAAGQGVLIYATGHEGRGIGLMNKLRAYVAQEEGADTVDANHLLGLPADARDYGDAAAVVTMLRIRSIRLLTNNPGQGDGPARARDHDQRGGRAAHRGAPPQCGLPVDEVGADGPRPSERLSPLDASIPGDIDPGVLLGDVRPHADRPGVVVKLAQSLDGRIATACGDSKWISSERGASCLPCIAGGVRRGARRSRHGRQDDPQLTVRAVPGASPTRVVLDSAAACHRSMPGLFTDDGSTLVLTTAASDPEIRSSLRPVGVGVEVIQERDGRVDLHAGLARLRELGMEVVLVEGGAALGDGVARGGTGRSVDRVPSHRSSSVPASTPSAISASNRSTDGIVLTNRTIATVGDDVIIAGDVTRPG